MRTAWLTLLAAGLAITAKGATINFQVSNLGGGEFQYNYSISGLSLQAGQSLDISFPGATYSALLAGEAGDSTCSTPAPCVGNTGMNWMLLLLPPNSPPGGAGDYLATADINNPSLAGPFTADFTLEPGAQAGSQSYTIFDTNFNTIASGSTTPTGSGGAGAVPEPASFPLALAGVLFLGVLRAVRR